MKNNKLYAFLIFVLINSVCFALVLLPKIDCVISLSSDGNTHISDHLALWFLITFITLLFAISFIQKLLEPKLSNVTYVSIMCSCILAFFGGIYLDVWYLFSLAQHLNKYELVLNNLNLYVYDNLIYYSLILIMMFVVSILFKSLFKISFENTSDKLINIFFIMLCIFIAIVNVIPLPIMNLVLFKYFHGAIYYPLPAMLYLVLNITYTIFTVVILVVSYRIRKRTKEQLSFLLKLVNIAGSISGFALLYQIFMTIYPYKMLADMGVIDGRKILYYGGLDIKEYWLVLGILFVFILALTLFRKQIKKSQFDDIHNEDNAGTEHGSAKWADDKYISEHGFYKKSDKLYVGTDEKDNKLYLPLTNRTLLAPPGGGKTTTVAIPLGLQYDGPLVQLDFKGEIYAVVARYRAEKFGRKQIAIDPFNITQQAEFHYTADLIKKPESLLVKYRINPFNEIPNDVSLRQRVLSGFASSFIVRDDAGGSSGHFYDNAEILIKGLIDYILKSFPKENQHFVSLLEIFNLPAEQLPLLYEGMLDLGGEAANAAGMLSKLGDDERGGIFSTAGRQLSWLTDINMQDLLSESNFSIDEVIDGNADLYLILPADTVVSHGRLIRMIISLVRGSLIRRKPSELPSKKICFLMDEIAQLGKCPDIEQAIEIFRSYGVVVWAIFQFLSQIEKFDKPDVFTNATTLQFFTNKDNDTMKFIQEKVGKTTILQKTLSNNKGDQRQKNQIFGGSVSIGEGESVNSGGVDLVHFDQIREMPKEQQWFLYDNLRPIIAKKIPYYLDDFFNGCFDPNPIEDKDFSRKVKSILDTNDNKNNASITQPIIKPVSPVVATVSAETIEITTNEIDNETAIDLNLKKISDLDVTNQADLNLEKSEHAIQDIQHIGHMSDMLDIPDIDNMIIEDGDIPDIDDIIETPEEF